MQEGPGRGRRDRRSQAVTACPHEERDSSEKDPTGLLACAQGTALTLALPRSLDVLAAPMVGGRMLLGEKTKEALFCLLVLHTNASVIAVTAVTALC